jgi:hypothetical protein
MKKSILALVVLLVLACQSLAQGYGATEYGGSKKKTAAYGGQQEKKSKKGHLKAKVSAHSVALSWTPSIVVGGNPVVTSVKIYRGTSSATETVLATIALGSLPACAAGLQCYTDTSVAAGTTYFYEITSSNSVGESPKSNEIMVLIPANAGVAPGAPTNLVGTPQ